MTFRGWRSILGGLELAATAALLKLTDFGRVPRCLLVFAPFPRVQVPLASPSWIATTPRTDLPILTGVCAWPAQAGMVPPALKAAPRQSPTAPTEPVKQGRWS